MGPEFRNQNPTVWCPRQQIKKGTYASLGYIYRKRLRLFPRQDFLRILSCFIVIILPATSTLPTVLLIIQP